MHAHRKQEYIALPCSKCKLETRCCKVLNSGTQAESNGHMSTLFFQIKDARSKRFEHNIKKAQSFLHKLSCTPMHTHTTAMPLGGSADGTAFSRPSSTSGPLRLRFHQWQPVLLTELLQWVQLGSLSIIRDHTAETCVSSSSSSSASWSVAGSVVTSQA